MDEKDDSKYTAINGSNQGYTDDVETNGTNDDDDGVNLRHPKKRKLTSLLSPEVPPSTCARKPSFGGRNTHTDWTESASFVLLEAWGDRFLQCGRKSLKFEEWQQVADKVSQVSNIKRTESQCRNRLDTLKKKYKKEKANLEKGVNSKWVYFNKMDMLLSSNSSVDEIRTSFGNFDSQSEDDEDDDDDDLVLPQNKALKAYGDNGDNGDSLKFLVDSVNKFSEIYEKVENSKIQQMIELEKMRMDFCKDLELQKRQIFDRAQAEITKRL